VIAAAPGEEASATPGEVSTAPGETPAPRLGPDGQPLPARPRRRRRRRPPQFGGAGENAAAPGEARRDAGPRPDNRPRRPRQGAPAPGGAREARPDQAAGGERGPRRESRVDRGRGDRREARGRGPGHGPGRGRDDRPKRVERKLYSFDSIVDRGFEDIEEEGGETRRVHWTIVKRTVADQISRKAVSQSYVLQRDGNDNDFPTLGAARNAVNKTIVHPEKLTLSKAGHAAAKGNSR
jgi:hypothetical protein